MMDDLPKECTECNLYLYSNKPMIPGRGILGKETDLFFIGEAPGQTEADEGQVFIGKAGNMLHCMIEPFLKKYKLNRWITNAVKCFPPVSLKNPRQGFRQPKSSEIQRCFPKLLAEIEQTDPQRVVLIPLGATAYSALFSILKNRSVGLGKEIGKHKTLLLGGKEYDVVPNWHPAYILRSMSKRPEFEAVIQTAIGLHHEL